MNIKDISLGFNRNETIHVGLTKGSYPFYKSVKLKPNTNTKVIIHCTEADKKLVPESIIREFVGNSKIVYEVEKKTNVRSKKITEVKDNKDKFIEYLNVNNIECEEGLLDKLREIEDNLEINSASRSRSFTLLKMSLRGAIGIHEGTGKEEFELDFTKYADGLIALTGSIGSGKSTTIENCHPYPRLMTRNGKLQDHFYLKDSYRKLLYVDDDGTYYSIEMLIDGRANGKVKYLVYTGKDLDNLEAVPECDGNSDSYEKWVNETFGPVELFLRTCFFAKETTKGIPDIAETTKGQKKELFTSLIGIDGLDKIYNAAKLKCSELSNKVDKIEAKFDDIDFDSIENNYNETLSKNRALLNNMKEQKSVLKAIIKEADAKKTELEALVPSTDTLDRMKDMFSAQKKQKAIIDRYEANIELYEKIKSEFHVMKSLKETVTELKGEFISKDLKLSKVKSKESELKSVIKNSESNINAFKKSHLLELKKSVCPTCGMPLEEHKEEELKAEMKANKSELKKLEKELEKARKSLEELSPELESAQKGYDDAKTAYDDAENEYKSSIPSSDIDLKDIEREEAEYTFVKSQFDLDKFNKLKDDINKLEDAINDRSSKAESEILKLEGILVESESKLTHVEFEIDRLISDISSYETKLDILNTDKEVQKKLREEHEVLVRESEQYDVIAKAFHKNGIQALELEAMAPEIAGITNSILASAYGDRFKISFETLRTGSSGQLIEDFSIMVEDTSTGTVRPLEWLSSGETVWIKEALYNAFTIERQRTTGFTFRTRFLDESDGSLDSSARMKYLNMIESAHKEGEVNHTVIITHSQELKDLIAQQINFSKN